MLSTKLKEAAGNGADATLYVDSVFSTYLYTGNGSTQTITNGIDLAGKGGLVWGKNRTYTGGLNHTLLDTNRGAGYRLFANDTLANNYNSSSLTSFNADGFSIGSDSALNYSVAGSNSYVSWTFRKAAKFFDVVTYTGNGVAGKQIAHSLGVAPGMVIVKQTDSSSNWFVYHRSTGNTGVMYFNATNPATTGSTFWNSQDPTSTDFYVGGGSSNLNGATYVAYLFAHDTSSTGIIQCGSFTTNGSGVITSPVNLGWEPQYVLYKRVDAARDWSVLDSMRGNAVANGAQIFLEPNLADAEVSSYGAPSPLATGFTVTASTASSTYIYMAIRMPNKPPTSGTQVYSPVTYTGDGATSRIITTGIITDLIIGGDRGNNGVGAGYTNDRLRGQANLITSDTSAEAVNSAYPKFDLMTGYNNLATGGAFNAPSFSYIRWSFKRAPGFFDEVCWTGTSATAQQINHNLGVAPELIITKRRDAVSGWPVYNKTITASNYLVLQDGRASAAGSTLWGNTEPTASVFTAGQTVSPTNATIVAYLFATLAGISKVGSYTGNGSTGQAIACGFSAGARFVLIKRTDSTGDWYTFDSARGLTSGSSPYLLLNSTAAEVTGNNGVYASTGGFTLGSTASTTTNINAATYIFLAVA